MAPTAAAGTGRFWHVTGLERDSGPGSSGSGGGNYWRRRPPAS